MDIRHTHLESLSIDWIIKGAIFLSAGLVLYITLNVVRK
jgi:hypothetical protein